MDCAYHVEDPRQRVASYAAVLVLTRAAAEGVNISIAQLGAIVAAFLPTLGPDALRMWSGMEPAEAVRTIKIDLLRHQIVLAEADTASRAKERGRWKASGRSTSKAALHAHRRKLLTEQEISTLDEAISQSVVASFFKFMTMLALDPDWYTPHITETVSF